ncbi:hypothetical protein N9917_00435 [Deltaproteobacteria bacterium]|nr:hypothetical protein [Deltaproteobacteria bacterium]
MKPSALRVAHRYLLTQKSADSGLLMYVGDEGKRVQDIARDIAEYTGESVRGLERILTNWERAGLVESEEVGGVGVLWSLTRKGERMVGMS